MFRSLKSISPGGYLRIAVDLLLIHLSLAAALSIAVLYHATTGNLDMARELTRAFPDYYWLVFWPLSAVFPITFAASGFYTRMRTYPNRYKLLVTARGAAIAAVVFLAANYFLFPRSLVARSTAVVFSVIMIVAIASARLLKTAVLRFVGSTDAPPSAPVRDGGVVLVVGGVGYIGSHLVRRLLESGYRVRALDNLVYGHSAVKSILRHPNFELVVGDCRNIQTVVSAVRDVRAIVHLAAIVGDPACDLDKQTALEINYAATRMLIEVAKGNGVERFIFASSCSVYGANDEMVDERSEVNPISLYAKTKVDSEEALLRARSDSFHPTILRLATVFGNSYRPRFDLVVNLLTARAFQEGTITIYNGQQWRPFIHVRDIAEAIIASLEAPVRLVSGEVFNVGDSRLNYTLSQVADVIGGVFPETKVEHVENSDRRNYRVSFDKIRNQLGFRCAWDIRDGVMELKHAFEDGSIQDYRDPYYSNQKFLQNAGSPSHTDETDKGVMAAFSSTTESRELVLEAVR